VSDLLALLRARAPGLDARVAFLGHAAPSVPAVLGGLSGPVVVLPLLLTAAYHSKVDLPAQLQLLRGAAGHGVRGVPGRAERPPASTAELRAQVRYGPVLGPHPRLIDAMERRVASAGTFDRATTGVVLAAAGSSDPAANATIRGIAATWQVTRGWRSVVPAYASAATPRVGEAVRASLAAPGVERVVVATYLLAPGVFADQIRQSALGAGACAVSPALGALPEVADVILDRYAATAAAPDDIRMWSAAG